MILYLDSGTLVKRYVVETGSQEVVEAIAKQISQVQSSSRGLRWLPPLPKQCAWRC